MTQVVIRGESVYGCDVCKRRIRIPTNKYSFDVVQRCIITAGCQGKLHRITSLKDVNSTPAFPPEVEGIQDWFARAVLYKHTQPVRTSQWVITHNLQNFPAFYVFANRYVGGDPNPTLVEIEPSDITTVDSNTTILTFESAESGVAHCVSPSSKNIVNFESTMVIAAAQDTIQLSSDTGELTIATLNSETNINLSITYVTSSGVGVVYALDDVTSINSAWVGANNVMVNGKRYTVRSFNVQTTPNAPLYFSTNVITDGVSFYVNAINGADVGTGEVLFLLSTSPHSSVDRTYNRYIDASNVNKSLPELVYTEGKCYSASTVIKSTYPSILVV